VEKTLHLILGNTIFFAAVCNMILALSVARSDATMARVMKWSHSIGVLWTGRLVILLGIGMVMRYRGVYLSSAMGHVWQGWISIALWAPVEIMGKRMVTPDLAVVSDGGDASSRLAIGSGIQLLVVTVIIGLMHSITST
jgi:hypothetical protein